MAFIPWARLATCLQHQLAFTMLKSLILHLLSIDYTTSGFCVTKLNIFIVRYDKISSENT